MIEPYVPGSGVRNCSSVRAAHESITRTVALS